MENSEKHRNRNLLLFHLRNRDDDVMGYSLSIFVVLRHTQLLQVLKIDTTFYMLFLPSILFVCFSCHWKIC